MKKLTYLTVSGLFLVLVMFTSCNSQTSPSENSETEAAIQQETATVTVSYFHGDCRCTACKAVGSVSQQTIADEYSENPNVAFIDINIDEAENNEIKDKFELSGSGLFVYDGSTKEDLTVFAFQKAVDSPKELSKKIVRTVNKML